MQAMKNVGAPLGAAVLGSALISAYRANLHLVGVPPAAARAIRESVFAGVAVAHQLQSATLAASVRAAFVCGMDASLEVSAGIAGLGIVLTLAFLPGRAVENAAGPERVREEGPRAVTG